MECFADAPEGFWRPMMTYLSVQAVCQVPTLIAAIRSPGLLTVVLGTGWWPFVYGYLADREAFGYAPGSSDWMKLCLKWFLVVYGNALPVLFAKAAKAGPRALTCLGVYATFLLGCNMLWTLVMGMSSVYAQVNGLVALLLSVSLAVRVAVLFIRGESLVYLSSDGMVLRFRTTTTRWVVSYTLWNATWAWKDAGIFLVVQDVFFLAFMAFSTCRTQHADEWGYDFGYARGATLAMFMTVDQARGVLTGVDALDYFDKAEMPSDQYWILLLVNYIHVLWLVCALGLDFHALWTSTRSTGTPAPKTDKQQESGDEAQCHVVVA
jgi:hypothetical protein